MKKLLRILLILLDGFLALTAFAGGIGLLADLFALPVEMLAGSPFNSCFVGIDLRALALAASIFGTSFSLSISVITIAL